MSTSYVYRTGLAGVLAGSLVLLSCDSGGFLKPDPTETPTPVSVQLDSVPTSLGRGDSVSVRATLLDGDGAPLSGYSVSWTSSDRQVAAVAPTGATQATLVGEDQGTTTITATYDQLSASASVKVHRRPTDLVYVSGSGQAGTAGEQLPDSLVVRAVDRRGDPVSGVDIEFVVASGGGSVAPAGGLTDADGRLSTAWTLGSAATQQVQARASEAQQRVQQLKDSVVVFTATTNPVLVGLSVLPDSPTVNMGDSVQFEALATTSDSSQIADNQVVWQSTDTAVATISPAGLLRSRKAGATRVIARSASGNAMADTTQVTVTSSGSSSGTLRISSPDTLRGPGDTLTLTVEARAADGSVIPNPDVQWSSLDPDIATVDTMGKVTAKALGTALITAASLCCSPDTTGVVVAASSAPTAGTLTISVPDTLRGIDDTMTLTVDARNADGTSVANPAVQWSSLNPDIATVDTMGRVTSKALGTALITAASLCCSSDTGAVMVVAGDPATVTDLSVASVGSDSMTIRWTQVDDGTGHPANYAVRYGSPTISWGSAGATEATITGTAIGNTATYSYTGLSSGTDYEFQVVAYRGTLNVDAVFGTLSPTASGTTTSSSPSADSLGTISDLSANAGDGRVTLWWTPAANATSQQPEFRSSGSSTWQNFGSALDGSTSIVSVTGLTNGSSYDFRVAASDGNTQTMSNTATATPAVSVSTAPVFGDSSSDRLIWFDNFESYGSTMAMDMSQGGPYSAGGDIGSSIFLDPTGGVNGGQAMRMAIPTGGGGPALLRQIPGLPTHAFVSFQFRLPAGTEVTAGKFLILHHEFGDNVTPGCYGHNMRRLQFVFAKHNDFTHATESVARLGVRPEESTSCDGPISEAYTDGVGYYNWDGAASSISRAPVLSQDPEISQAPWNPVNDGNWHTFTVEYKTGDGTNGYIRAWYDGHMYWDSSSGPMNYPGRLTEFLIDWVSGDSKLYAFDCWYDNIRVWQR